MDKEIVMNAGTKEDRLKIADGVELCISKNIVDNPDAVIILLHGLCEHSGRYAGVTAHLNALGYSVYRYDHRGHGCSGGRRGYIEDFNLYIDDADKIVKLAREENSDAPIFMLGHSMGGFISASYGVKYPDRISGQILSGAAVILLPLFEELQDSVYASDPLVPIPNSLAELICRNSSVVKAYEEDPLVLKEFTTKLMSEVLIRGAKWLIPLEMDRIQREIGRSTLMVVVGTSGSVYPAANFVHWARQAGAQTVYVGPEPPLNAHAFTRVVEGNAGEVLPGLFELTHEVRANSS